MACREPGDRAADSPRASADLRGGCRRISLQKSRHGDAEIDRAAAHVLRHCGEAATLLEFSPYGYDERQYCSPGFKPSR